MSTSSIYGLSSGYVQSILNSALQNTGLEVNQTGNTVGGIDTSLSAVTDNNQLSPFAQVLSTLQQLQQSDPTKYQQVTQQIAANLQSAAQTAQSEGNTAAANQLNQLANDFSNASKSGQLPDVQDLARAVGGHHHHHHSRPASADAAGNSADSSSSSGSNSSSTSGTSQMLDQLLSAFQANGAGSDALNPMSIIVNTLSSAGISGSTS